MSSFRIFLALAVTVTSFASANFRNGPIQAGDAIGVNPLSWALSSPDLSEHYTQYLPSLDNLKHGTHPIPAIETSEPYFSSASKRIPKENKGFKKATKEDRKFSKLESSNCQEIKTKGKDTAPGVTCYKCKDPKNGSTYQTCAYGTSPGARRGFESYLDEPSPFRLRRSDIGKRLFGDSRSAATRRSDDESPYHFSEDYFLPEATHELPAEYEKNIENCDRVEKDSMICMVCKDPKTNGKYEQCSYVAQPKDKAYAYTKSSSFNGPKNDNVKKEETKRRPQIHRSDEDDEDDDREAENTDEIQDRRDYTPKYQEYSSYPSYEDSDDDEEPKESSRRASKSNEDCKTVEKDSKTCTVCRDRKTGRKSEVCSYESRPKDKHYRYTKSKSFGNPEPKVREDAEDEDDDESSEKAESSDRSEKNSDDDAESFSPSEYSYKPSNLKQKKKKHYYDSNAGDFIKSESEKISQKVRSNSNDCEKVEKDSMVCTVCKDPKTGGNFEQCSYSYKPRSKMFAYSTSKSFGNPTKDEESDEEESDEESPAESLVSPVYSFSPGYGYSDKSFGFNKKSEPQTQESTVWERSKPKAESMVDVNFHDASKRKAEIEKFMEKFQAEDWSNCTKVKKGEMTCYRCKDEKEVEKEECIFLAEPETSTETETDVAKTEEKVVVLSAENSTVRQKELSTTESPRNPHVRSKREKKQEESTDQYEKVPLLDEELYEAEPYEYVSETRPVYDKVLGMTLPRYMLEVSESEKEFDEVVAKSRFN